MATFTYKAKASNGQTITGVLTAESHQAALRTLDERALFPILVKEGGQAAKTVLPGRKRKLKLRVLTSFYSQLADLLRAGVPVLRSLDVLARQNANPLLSEVLKEVHADVSGGETLGDSMGKHPNAFSPLAVAMVRAGEQGGFLEDVLTRIAIFTEKQDELKNKLIGSMIYPVVLMSAGVVVVSFLMASVVPKIRGLLDRVEKPWLTTMVFAISDFVRADGIYLLGFLVVGVGLLVPMLKSDKGKQVMDELKLKTPVLGPIVKMVAICRFCRILGTMLHNGVPILAALKISKDSAGNRLLAEQIDRAAENVQKGETLAMPLGSGGLFPPDIVDMIAVAEESNNLEGVLVQIADSNEARTARQIDLGVRLLEPLMLLLMAIFVVIIAVALLVPILKMSSAGV
jgi:general secretion pathway protein F/type IV pilus assembly protein PilC